MKILVTGANGFLGRCVVESARRAGLPVRAGVRPATEVGGLPWQDVEVVRADLRSTRELPKLVEGCDAVIHTAATVAGDLYSRFSGTVVVTENLIAAMRQKEVNRMVLVSSYSVYDYDKLPLGAVLDENGPLRDVATSIDTYAQAKLYQERVVRDAMSQGLKATIVRPGVLFGPGNSWSSRLGMQISDRLWLRIGTFASLPLIYVENCADALIACVQSDRTIGKTYNVLDDELVTQRNYTARLAKLQPVRPRVIPIPWLFVLGLAEVAQVVNRVFFDGKAKIPQMLTIEGAVARGLPLRHRGDQIRQDTDWRPRYNLDQALERISEQENASNDY